MKKKLHLWIILMTMLMVSSFSMSGCRGLELENKTEEIAGYTESQARIVLVNELSRYEKAYMDAILDVPVDETEGTFEDVLVSNVKEFMEQLKLLCMLAEERGVALTSQERDELRELSEEYYSGLTEADRDIIGCSPEDVQQVYEDYYLAEKLIDTLTADAKSDISDSEAKIIEIQQICTSDLKKALAILKLSKIDGYDFASLASRYTEASEVTIKLQRGSRGGLYEETAFSLDEGEISNIIEVGGLYYIIKCTNGYDERATAERKEILESAINTRAFSQVYDSYKSEHPVRFRDRFWDEIDLSELTEADADNFFELYDENFHI